MAYRWKGKNFQVDPDDPRAEGICDRCGFRWNLYRLTWQYDYQGTSQLQNTRLLVCDRCYDKPQPQLSPYILPPDPPPIYNARPEPYVMDEASWLLTQDGSIITTQDGVDMTTALPNPSDAAATSYLTAIIPAPAATITVAYLDLFNGDPSSGGVSVLSAITGSSVRTDIAADLSLAKASTTYVNPDYIVVTTASQNQTNVNWIGFYTASISGSLLWSAPVSASPTIALENPVSIAPLGLTFRRT